jgi:hypothetical protein
LHATILENLGGCKFDIDANLLEFLE